MYWANFLHIYQPPIQNASILNRIVKESYRKITEGLLAHPKTKITLNINAGLTQMLAVNGYNDVIGNIKTLLERNQIELTGTAIFHSFLPKLSEEEIIRQIILNNKINRKYFGLSYKPKGFFPPEMAYNPKIGKIVKDLGFSWIILDETACPLEIDYSKTYQNSQGLGLFFRERSASFEILSARVSSVKSFVAKFQPKIKNFQYLLTAMDGETFGHHRPGLEEILWKIPNESTIKPVLVSELSKLFPEKIIIEPNTSSWAFVSEKGSQDNPFVRWDDQKNQIHQKQWKLTNLAIAAVKKDGSKKTRNMLDKALYSDQYWWASAKPWWSLEMIEHGALLLYQTILACKNKEEEILAKKLYLEIILLGFKWQRNGKIDRMSKEEDEEIRQQLSKNDTILTPEKCQELIISLEKQLRKATKEQQYQQAEQIKKRIWELKDYQENLKSLGVGETKVNQ